MELFKISCVTCQASLSVRNESLLGQIVSCPRCGSMVEVAAPVGAAPEAAPVTTPVEAPMFADDVAESVTVTAAAEDWATSSAAAKYRIVAWSSASFVVGAVLVAAVMFSRRESPTENAPSPTGATVSPGLTVGDLDEPRETPGETIDEPPLLPVEVPELPSEAPTIVIEPAESSLPEQIVDPPAAETTKEVPVEPVNVARRLDPLELDPAALNLSTLNRATDDATDSETAKRAPDAELEAAVVGEPSAVVPDVPSTLPVVRLSTASTHDIASREAESQLAMELPALRVEAISLNEFLRLVSRLAGVPVSVSPESLLMAGITARHKVSVDLQDASLGKVLNTALEPLHLAYQVVGPHVVVVRRGERKRRNIDYPINDLVSTSLTGEQLAQWVERLVGPTTWHSAGGSGTVESTSKSLHIEQTERTHYHVLLFLERLRLARGLATRSRFPTERLASRPALVAVDGALSAPATFTFSHDTALEEVFAHWQTELNLPLLVDWPALAEDDLWPSSLVTCAIAGKPWREALDAVLSPLGLGWRAVAGRAIEITSADNVATQPSLEIYSLERDLGEAMDELREIVEQHSAAAATALLYDPTGHVLLALQPATTHRRLLRWLVERQLYVVD